MLVLNPGDWGQSPYLPLGTADATGPAGANKLIRNPGKQEKYGEETARVCSDLLEKRGRSDPDWHFCSGAL